VFERDRQRLLSVGGSVERAHLEGTGERKGRPLSPFTTSSDPLSSARASHDALSWWM